MHFHLADAGWLAAASVMLLLLIRFGWRPIWIKHTGKWPRAWATIRSSEIQVMKLDDKNDIELPCFSFSYVINETNFLGRFSLVCDAEEERLTLAKKMIDRRFELQYDPKHPSNWYIPNKKIEGYEVEQKMSPRFFERLSPPD
jgi:hypothetical protein